MKLLEVYYFRVNVPPEYEADLRQSIEKVTPLTWGNYDRVTRVSSPEILRCRPLPGANPNAGNELISEEDDVLQLECVAVEFSVPRDDALMHSVIEQGILPVHPWDEPGIFVFPAYETRKWEA